MNIQINEYAKKINELHNLIGVQMKTPIKTAIEIGKLLIDVKENIGHGNFETWIHDNCQFNTVTAWRYSKLYIHNKSLIAKDLQEAYKQIEQIEYQEKQTEQQRKNSMINEYLKTGIKPDGWDRSLDYEYSKRKKEDEDRTIRIEEIKTKQNENKKNDYNNNIENLLDEAKEYIKQEENRIKERINFNSKIKDLNDLYNLIDDYLFGINENQQLECYHQIIKYCKVKANELQVKTNNL